MRHLAIFISTFLLVASFRTSAAQVAAASTPLDSIVLERTNCFGACPAYRLKIDRQGRVDFQSRNPGESVTATDSIPAISVSHVIQELKRVGFYDLPRRIMKSKALCTIVATDHSTVTLSAFGHDSVKSVEHYLGCYGPGPDVTKQPKLIELQHVYSLIDSIARVSRWARPPQRRSN